MLGRNLDDALLETEWGSVDALQFVEMGITMPGSPAGVRDMEVEDASCGAGFQSAAGFKPALLSRASHAQICAIFPGNGVRSTFMSHTRPAAGSGQDDDEADQH